MMINTEMSNDHHAVDMRLLSAQSKLMSTSQLSSQDPRIVLEEGVQKYKRQRW